MKQQEIKDLQDMNREKDDLILRLQDRIRLLEEQFAKVFPRSTQ